MTEPNFQAAFWYPGDCTIIVIVPDGPVVRLYRQFSSTIISSRCPVLAAALDDGPHGCKQASIEACSGEVAISFLRYIHDLCYLTAQEVDAPCSLLKLAGLYKLAKDYDLPQLQASTQGNFTMEVDASCTTPQKPTGLCEAIRFIYSQLPQETGLQDTLLNYCVSNFRYHGLGQDAAFRSAAYEIPEFHRGLIRTNVARNFQDDGASEIVCLPVCKSTPPSLRLQATDLHSDVFFTEWYDTDADNLPASLQAKRCKQDVKFTSQPKLGSASSPEAGLQDSSGSDPSTLAVCRSLSILSLGDEKEPSEQFPSWACNLQFRAGSDNGESSDSDAFSIIYTPSASESGHSVDEDGFTLVPRFQPDWEAAKSAFSLLPECTVSPVEETVPQDMASPMAAVAIDDFDLTDTNPFDSKYYADLFGPVEETVPQDMASAMAAVAIDDFDLTDTNPFDSKYYADLFGPEAIMPAQM